MNTIYSFIYLTWYYYLLTCEAGNLGSLTSSIEIHVESFESAYQDNWLDSKMNFLQK